MEGYFKIINPDQLIILQFFNVLHALKDAF